MHFSQEIIFITPSQGIQGTADLEVTLIASGVNFYDEYTYHDVYFSGDGLNAHNEQAVSQTILQFVKNYLNRSTTNPLYL